MSMKKKNKVTAETKLLVLLILVAVAFATAFFIFQPAKSDDSIRSQYFPENYQKQMFKELPLMPEDFFQKQILLITNRIQFDPEIFNESYWKQPEWFSASATKNDYITRVVPLINKHIENPGRGGIWCVGIFPAESIVFSKNRKEFDVYMWIRSAPIVKKWMGVGIYTEYPKYVAISENPISKTPEIEVIQDPEYIMENINITVTPDIVKLGPSYKSFHIPRDELVYYTYDYDYTEMIKINIKLSDDIKPGNYAVKLRFGSPPKELSEQWYLEHGLMYTDPIRDFTCGTEGKQSSYYLAIVVEE